MNSPSWAQHYHLGLIPPNAPYSLPVHPTQIYSSIDALVLFLLLSAFYPLRRRDGEVLGLLMLTYPISRFVIEYLRNDEGVFFAGMTISLKTISASQLPWEGAFTGHGCRHFRNSSIVTRQRPVASESKTGLIEPQGTHR